MGIKRRLDKLEHANRTYLTIEGVLTKLNLKEKKTLTSAETQELERLSNLELEPRLQRFISRVTGGECES